MVEKFVLNVCKVSSFGFNCWMLKDKKGAAPTTWSGAGHKLLMSVLVLSYGWSKFLPQESWDYTLGWDIHLSLYALRVCGPIPLLSSQSSPAAWCVSKICRLKVMIWMPSYEI